MLVHLKEALDNFSQYIIICTQFTYLILDPICYRKTSLVTTTIRLERDRERERIAKGTYCFVVVDLMIIPDVLNYMNYLLLYIFHLVLQFLYDTSRRK